MNSLVLTFLELISACVIKVIDRVIQKVNHALVSRNSI